MAKSLRLPRISRIEFFRHREDELAISLARAITENIERFPNAKVTAHHAAIWAWSAAVINVPNGGFTQFFYNQGGDSGVKELAVLLEKLDFTKGATVLRDAVAVYRKNRGKFKVDNPWDGLFGSIPEFDKPDRSFMDVLLRGNRVIESWIRENIRELATDETGAAIDTNFTGVVEIPHANGQVKESLEVKKGKPHGAFREYFEDGSVKICLFYKAGKISSDFWPNGQLKRKESREGKNRIIEWFYPNGAVQKRYKQDKDGFATEPIRLYHENGQLAEEVTCYQGKKRGPWLKFFSDGKPELQAEYIRDEKLVVHNAWNEKRKQIVKDGKGVFKDYPNQIDWAYDVFLENDWLMESELKGGIPHGKVTTYCRGVLWSIDCYVDGKPEGDATTFWENGRIRSKRKFVKGKEGESRELPKYDHPEPAVVLSIEADEKLYAAWRHIPIDEYPRPLNLEKVQKKLKLPQFLLDVHERNLAGKLKDEYEDSNTFDDGIAYFLMVNPSGEVISAKANGSGVYSMGEWGTYIPFLHQLRFAPGRIRGRAIECQVLAWIKHTFVEGKV